VVTVAGNHPRNRKMCAIGLENAGRKHEKHEFSWIQSNHVSVVTTGNHIGNRKMYAIAHENGQQTWKICVWRRHSNDVSVVTITRNCPRNRKLCAIAHENWQKTWKRRVLAMPLQPRIGGHGRWKSSRVQKNVRFSPRKWRQKT
jgi:hypothetical protein